MTQMWAAAKLEMDMRSKTAHSSNLNVRDSISASSTLQEFFYFPDSYIIQTEAF